MTYLSRFLLFIFGLVFMALAVWTGLVTTHVLDGGIFGLHGVSVIVNPAAEIVPYRLMWLGISVAILTLGAVVFVASMTSTGEDSEPRVTLKSPDPQIYGDTRVTMTKAGLRSIVARAAQTVEGVREADARATLSRKGWMVACRVSTWDRTVIPEMAPLVTEHIRDVLEHHTGIPVANITIHTQYEPLTTRATAARVV